MRIVAWNVESLAPWLATEPGPAAFAAQVRALGSPDVLCLQEVRIRPQDAADVARMHALLPGYRCHASLCRDARNVRFRGGRAHGVATFVREEYASSAIEPAWDREGRAIAVRLPAYRLAIVNLYAVNGTTKPYVDPDTGEPAGDRFALKRRFQDRVFALAEELRATATAGVVLAGDWNVSRTAADVTPRLRTEEPHATARAELNAHLVRGAWLDVWRATHPEARGYTWFGRTRTGALDAARVDYIVVSTSLAGLAREAAILDDKRLRPRSDHAPIAVELANVHDRSGSPSAP